MQIASIQSAPPTCQTILDVCLLISEIRNTSKRMISNTHAQFSFFTKNSNTKALPYQVLKHNKSLSDVYKSGASISLESYCSGKYTLLPMKRMKVNQICTFRLRIPMDQLLNQQLVAKIQIFIGEKEQVEFQEKKQNRSHPKHLIKYINYASILGLNSYLPVFSADIWNPIAMQANIETQLLGMKFNKKNYMPRAVYYNAIDTIVLENNRLINKKKMLQKQIQEQQKQLQAKGKNQQSKFEQKVLQEYHFQESILLNGKKMTLQMKQSEKQEKNQGNIIQKQQQKENQEEQDDKLSQQVKSLIDELAQQCLEFQKQQKIKHNQLIIPDKYFENISQIIYQNNEEMLQNPSQLKTLRQKLTKRESSTSNKSENNDFLTQFPEYKILQKYKKRRIFTNQLNKSTQLCNFAYKFLHEISNSLQLNWPKYTHLVVSKIDQKTQINRKRYYQQYIYSINKIMMQGITKKVSRSQRKKFWQNHGKEELTINGIQQNIDDVAFRCVCLNDKNKMNSTNPQSFIDLQSSCQQKQSNQFIVLVHGLGANYVAMTFYQKILKYLYPDVTILNSRSNQQVDQSKTIEQMGRSLATEVQLFLQGKQDLLVNAQISFIAHSLGGLIVRAALLHLQPFKLNMNCFISLSCPHLGHLRHSHNVTKIGMMAFNKIWHSHAIDTLLFKDSKSKRESCIYNLAYHSGLSWFKSIYLYGSHNDGYVSCNSALFVSPQGNIQDAKNNNESQSDSERERETDDRILIQIAKNFMKNCENLRVSKQEVYFNQAKFTEKNYLDGFIGRNVHLAYLTNENFIKTILLNSFGYLLIDNTLEK